MTCMFSDPNTLPIVAKAAKTNARRDNLDTSAGFSPPKDCAPDVFLRTAMCAIHCGLSQNDFDCVAEGYAMLQTFHKMMVNKETAQ